MFGVDRESIQQGAYTPGELHQKMKGRVFAHPQVKNDMNKTKTAQLSLHPIVPTVVVPAILDFGSSLLIFDTAH